MGTITTLPDMGKAFEMMKAKEQQKTCTKCGNTYHNPELSINNTLNLPSLVKCFERPNNMEAYPYYGCPVCGTDDYLK